MSSEKSDSIIYKLAKKWQENTITEEERILFNQWYDAYEDVKPKLLAPDHSNDLIKQLYQAIVAKEQIPLQQQKNRRWWFISAAAIIVVFLSFGGYLYLKNTKQQSERLTALKKSIDIPPGQNKAVLTLADGAEITLNSAKNGVLASQGNLDIFKNKEGQIAYQNSKAQRKLHTADFNTISVPRGGQFQINLPDGTKVWLNSASTLKFPLTFNKNERHVELTGEAYFEVNQAASSTNKSRKVPFIVSSRAQRVEVLGTHFNINAYSDEQNIKTTLLEGSVKIVQLSNRQSILLKPGQQSILNKTITVADVDANQAIEWQKGYFSFENETLENIMRTISRWYDVEITLEEGIRHRRFGGRISKFEQISQILKIMEKTKVIHFKIEEGRVSVMP